MGESSGVHTHLLEHKASLSKIRRLIRADLVRAGATPASVFDCLVAVSEACTGAITTAGDDVPTRLTWKVDRTTAEFAIEGLTKEPSSDEIRRLLTDAGYDEAEFLGRGVIRGLMDTVVMEDGPTKTLRMTKKLR